MEWDAAVSYALLFFLVAGMSATVDISNLKTQLTNVKAIMMGLVCQFVILPFLGFVAIKVFSLDQIVGQTLLVVASSPGGSYSNWWCSMFNADLALSVTMTAMSTFFSLAMLPLNLFIYTYITFPPEDGKANGDIVETLDWRTMFISLVVVIGAILIGLLASMKVNSKTFNKMANLGGNIAGISLIVFSAALSIFGGTGVPTEITSMETDEEAMQHVKEAHWKFYVGVAFPCVVGLAVANLLTSTIRLKKPERCTVSIECCYQNTGIASTVAISMFEGQQQKDALSVPLYYGLVEAVLLAVYCIVAWKAGWTKAPSQERFCTMLTTSYEVLSEKELEMEKPDPSFSEEATNPESDWLTVEEEGLESQSSRDR